MAREYRPLVLGRHSCDTAIKCNHDSAFAENIFCPSRKLSIYLFRYFVENTFFGKGNKIIHYLFLKESGFRVTFLVDAVTMVVAVSHKGGSRSKLKSEGR